MFQHAIYPAVIISGLQNVLTKTTYIQTKYRKCAIIRGYDYNNNTDDMEINMKNRWIVGAWSGSIDQYDVGRGEKTRSTDPTCS